jgi:LysM domain
MTIAPELPPVPAARRAVSRRRPRAVVVDRTPAGVVALVEPPRSLTLVPAPPAEPGTGREHRPAGPVPLRQSPGPVTGPRPPRPVTGPRPVGARVVREAGGGLRLTRRGRLAAAAAVLLIAVLTLVGTVSRVGALSESSPVPASAPAQVVVAPGETLWSIAERVAPGRDPRDVVARIRELNGLPSADVAAGRTLLLRAPSK